MYHYAPRPPDALPRRGGGGGDGEGGDGEAREGEEPDDDFCFVASLAPI